MPGRGEGDPLGPALRAARDQSGVLHALQDLADVALGDQQRIAHTGDVLHFPSGTWHGATMLDEEVILVDIFSPIREDFLT